MSKKTTDQAATSTRIAAPEMQTVFYQALTKVGFSEVKARACAQVFTENSVDGVYTHGVNRFARFVQYVKLGHVKPGAEPALVSSFGGLEQWNGGLGPGPLNALQATDRAMELAKRHGIGCVALAETNHWMRGGTYGWKAAKAGFVFIGWTNTIANMPAWKAADSRLGNNPLVFAVPYGEEAIVLDMAMSQYSFGAIEQHKMKQELLAVDGGYDKEGNMTKDPVAILGSFQGLPIGYWKGAGLSLLLDILAAILSGGDETHRITQRGVEYGLSQVFIAIDLAALANYRSIASVIREIIGDYHGSLVRANGEKPTFPGERVLRTRKENLALGVPVLDSIWAEVLAL